MKQSIFKVGIICLLFLIPKLGLAQIPNVNERYVVCKKPLGSNCNSLTSGAISCAFEWGTMDPCGVYNYYTVDPQGNKVLLKCCSAKGGTIGGNTPYVYGGHDFLPADTSFKLLIKCDGEGSYADFYDFSSIVSSYDRPGMTLSNDGDSLVIGIYDTDTVEPFIKLGTYVEVKFDLDEIDAICSGGMPFTLFFNDIKMNRVPTSDIQILNNPLKNKELIFSFKNTAVKNHLVSLEIIDLNGKLIKSIDISKIDFAANKEKIILNEYSAGIYFFKITTKEGVKSYKISIQ